MFFKVKRGRIDHATPTQSRKASFDANHLEVRMFNVGAGEAALVVFPDGRVWMVDCGSGNHPKGDNKKLGRGIARYMAARGLTLAAMIATHPHIDHGGAFWWLLEEKPAVVKDLLFVRADEDWDIGRVWMTDLDIRLTQMGIEPILLVDSHRVVEIDDDVTAHLFAGHGASDYTSVWLHLRYKQTALLFTGDVKCGYEKLLLRLFPEYDFTSDVLKITHHGSSSGTSTALVGRVRQGISLASTTADHHHRLEADTLERVGGLGRPRRVFETVIDGDITLRTDGDSFGSGVLYEAEFTRPGLFEAEIGATTVSLAVLNKQRNEDRPAIEDPTCT